MGLTLLAQANLPHSFWDHSFSTSVHLIKRLPTSALKNFSSPCHALYNRLLDYATLKTFGYSCFPFLHPYNQHKMDYRSQECVYLGLSPLRKGHKCLAADGRVYISKDVKFNEARFPYKELSLSNVSSKGVTIQYPSVIPLVSQTLSSGPFLLIIILILMSWICPPAQPLTPLPQILL